MAKGRSGDTVGKKIGKLLVLETAGKNQHSKHLVKCLCDCGKETIVIESRVRNGLTQSCGCNTAIASRKRFFKDMTGEKIGRLLFIKEVFDERPGAYWECLCDCGTVTIVHGGLVRGGHTTSCGCFKTEQILKAVTKHGKSKDLIYFLWNTMMERCYNPNSTSYHKYGERGIKVCERWQVFENFFEDMGDKPDGLSLERIDVNGDYHPDNCKWGTASEQAFNIRKRSNNTSGRTGVDLDASGLWRARIWKDKKCYKLGYFESYEEACEARSNAELELYGFIKE